MNKKGFTLIELLAVIVILAIIALIATPIVLNIINDAKEQSGLRSADFYLDALELSIAQAMLEGEKIGNETYSILSNGNICLSGETAIEACTNQLEVEVKGDAPKNGTITILNGEIDGASLTLDNKEIMKNSKGELVYVKTLEEVCEYKEGTKGEISSKYECKVDPNRDPYTFYILSYLDESGNITTNKETAESVNLIMDSNIRTGGESVKESTPSSDEQSGIIKWIEEEDYLSVGGSQEDWDSNIRNIKGPITAMNYLAEATKNWINANEIKINKFSDETAINVDTNIMPKTYKIYARLPHYLELSSLISTDAIWLINYLSGDDDETLGIKDRMPVKRVLGYWTLSHRKGYTTAAWGGYYKGVVKALGASNGAMRNGVRPVITLKI